VKFIQRAGIFKVNIPKIHSPYSSNGGKQWQTTPKNLPRMQRTRAIPVD